MEKQGFFFKSFHPTSEYTNTGTVCGDKVDIHCQIKEESKLVKNTVDLFQLSELLQSKLCLNLWRADGKKKIVYLSTRELMALLNLDSLALT